MEKMKTKAVNILKWSEKYTKTDMIYLARSGFWLNLNTIIVAFFSFLLYIAFANLITKEIYGDYQFIISLGTILGGITLTGMNGAITQSVARNKEGSFKKSVLVQLRWGIIPFLTSLAIAAYYTLNKNFVFAASVLLIGILLPVLNAFNTYSAFIFGKKDFKRAFFYSQILNFSYYPIMILSLFFIKNAFWLVAVNFTVNTIVTVVLYFLTVRFYRPNNIEDPETISFGKHMSLASILGLIMLQIDNVFVFHFLGTIPLAIYAFATNIPDRFMALFKNISTAALPKFSARSSEDLKKNIVSKSFRFALFLLCGSVIYAALAPIFFHLLFPQYQSSVKYSQLYSLILAISALSYLPVNLLTATKARKGIYIYNVLNPLISITFMFVGILSFGVWGILYAKAIAGVLSFIILLVIIFSDRHGRETQNSIENEPL